MRSYNLTVLVLVLSLFSCGSCHKNQQGVALTQQEIDDQLIAVNKQMIKDDKLLIDNFVKEKGWDMKKTGTGLQYWIYQEGIDTTTARSGMRATVSYELRLLDGTLCYQTPEGEYRSFVIGHSDIETGLHEAMVFMTPGDKAKVILPPHLAYGLTGDMAKIPLQSTLVYDLSLISLE